jgi:hypothetical protein
VASDEERLARELAAQLEQLRVEDVLVQTLVTVSSIGYGCLGLTEETKDARDLQQTQRAIAVMQALTPVLGTIVPPEAVRDFESSVANLQLAYATAAGRQAAESKEEPAPAGEQPAEPEEEPTEPVEPPTEPEEEPAEASEKPEGEPES